MIEFHVTSPAGFLPFRKEIDLLPPNTSYKVLYPGGAWSIYRKSKKRSLLHCETGPASYFQSDFLPGYYLGGRSYTKQDWERELYKRKLKKVLK